MAIKRKVRLFADNMTQGVSQQVPSKQTLNHMKERLNLRPSIVVGNTKRPSLNFLAATPIADAEGKAFHTYIRGDGQEEYVIVASEDGIQVFDRTSGVAFAVAAPEGYGYLSSTEDAKDALRFLTLADTTFICNREVEVAMDPTLTEEDPEEALIYCTQGDYATTYRVYLNGIEVARTTTGDTNQASTSTENIMGNLKNQLEGTTNVTGNYPPAGLFTVTGEGSILHIQRVDGQTGDMTFTVTDSISNEAIRAVSRTVQRFEELPDRAPHGYRVKVTHSAGTEYDDYYVKFEADDPTMIDSEGHWVETVGPGVLTSFDSSTMPHTLVREANGTFTFSSADTWSERTKGDDTTNSVPSFVGKTINWLYFFENRLGFLSGGNIVSSRPSGYFNFWNGSARTRLDTDPIDIAATASEDLTLRFAFPFDQKLVVFADTAQLISTSTGQYTWKTAGLKVSSEYPVDARTIPVVSGRSVFFISEMGEWSTVMELQAADNSEEKTFAVSVSDHVPQYIPSQPYQLISSPTISTLFLVPDNELDPYIYTYDWLWRNRERVISSWGKMNFGGEARILGGDFHENQLRAIVDYQDARYLTSMVFNETGTWTDTLEDTHLDMFCRGVVSYDEVSNQSTVTFPMVHVNPTFLGTLAGSSYVRDLEARFVEMTSDTVAVFSGELVDVAAGDTFTMSYTYATPYAQKYGPRGEMIPDETTRFQVSRMEMNVTDTGPFEVIIQQSHRDDRVKKFTGLRLGEVGLIVDAPAILSGSLAIKPKAQNTDLTITLTSTNWTPFCITSTEWVGNKTGRLK